MKSRIFRIGLLLGGLGTWGCGKGAEYPKIYDAPLEIDDSVPFSFDLSAEHVSSSCKTEIADLLRHMDAIAALSAENARFVTVAREMELYHAEFSNRLLPIMFLKYVSPSADVRSAAGECEIRMGQSMVEVYGRDDLHRIVKAVVEKKEMLDAQDAQLLQSTLNRFVRSGLELAPEKRKVFSAKKKTLIELESKFQTNLDEWKDGLVVSREDLAGLGADYIATLERVSGGKYLVPLDYPHYYPFMDEAQDANARKRLEYKFSRRGGLRNVKLLERAIRLRHELATMMGYQNHAQRVLKSTMAKTPERVEEFLEKLTRALEPSARADIAEMLAAKQKDLGKECAGRIESWDFRYYDNQLRKAKYGITPQKLKEWFPLDVVVRGMFSIYENLLGVQFAPAEGPTWHEEVTFFRVMEQGKTRAYFYLDLFPRPGKYGHAASFTVQKGMKERSGAYRAPVSAIVANFTPPTEGQEPLLTHDEVETLFHEFGHVMHQTLTSVRYASFSGTNVKQDFVETPSQMFESWVWQPETIQRISRHHRTGEPLPADVIAKLVASRLHHMGSRRLRQVALSAVDLMYHTSPGIETTSVYARIMRDIRRVPIQEGTYPQASFTHIMNGYGGTYYSYLWSESIAMDMFQRFQQEGLSSPGAGADFRRWILEPGCTQDPDELVRGFLGREPNHEALWNWLGISSTRSGE